MLRYASLPAVVLLFCAGCASRTTPQAHAGINANQNSRPTAAASLHPAPPDGGKAVAEPVAESDVPPEFEKVDFKNFSYPTSMRKRDIRLKDGSYEYPDPYGGGDTFDLTGVDFADVTGDGRKDAIVRLRRISCGGSCDGSSQLFYVYSARRNKPNLYWRIETGSLGYGCGLKSLDIKGRKVTLELFNRCRSGSVSFEREAAGEDGTGKFGATAYTRFRFVSNGKTVALKGRQTFPFPQGNVMNYDAEISIGDD
jgi:hypothetical protein